MYEVAITGIGVVSCLGIGREAVQASLREGRSGIVFDQERKDLGFRGCLTGRIEGYKRPDLDRKKRKTMTDFTLWTYSAAAEAIETAGWRDEEIRSPETGLIVGNDSTSLANIEGYRTTSERKSTLPIGATLVFKALNSTVSMNLNTLLGNLGASWTLSAACASGGHAIGQAADLIALGRQERVVCGGAQEITWESVCSFDATNAFSIREDEPAVASRPFDLDRDGLVPSGGAAMVTLERMDLAKKRGAAILGKVGAYAFSSDGSKLSVPSGEGLERCMTECLTRSGLKRSDIRYVCAHATSTLLGDLAEAQAIHGLFGEECPWVSSTKSMTGHEMWMSGAAQVVYTTLMRQGRFIAPNLNFRGQEKEAPPIRVAPEIIDTEPAVAMLNSAGFGGTNSCLLIDYRDT